MPGHWYLDPGHVPREYDPAQPAAVAATNFITAFILYSKRRGVCSFLFAQRPLTRRHARQHARVLPL